MSFRDEMYEKVQGSKVTLPRLTQTNTFDRVSKKNIKAANATSYGVSPFKSDALNRRYKNTVKTLYAQGNNDPLGNAYSAVSEYRDIATAAYDHQGADPLKAAEDQYQNKMFELRMGDSVRNKSYAELTAMLDESRRTKTTDTARQQFYAGLPDMLQNHYNHVQEVNEARRTGPYANLMNDPMFAGRFGTNRAYSRPLQLTGEQKTYWDEMRNNPETAAWAAYENKPMTPEVRAAITEYAAGMTGQADTKETQWLENYIKKNTVEGAKAWTEAEPGNTYARDTLYFLENDERYAGTAEDIWYRVQQQNAAEATQERADVAEFMQRMPQITQDMQAKGMKPFEYFSSGNGTEKDSRMWQKIADSEDPEVAMLTEYAYMPWDDAANAAVQKYMSQDTEPVRAWEEKYGEVNPEYYQENKLTLGNILNPSHNYASINDGMINGMDMQTYNALYELDPEEAERYRQYKSYEYNYQMNQVSEMMARKRAEADPVNATVGSWLLAPMKSVNFFDIVGQSALTNTGLKNTPVDYFRTAVLGNVADIYQGTVAENIESPFLRTLYGVGNSTVNTLMTLPLGSAGAAIMLGSQAGQSKMQELARMRMEGAEISDGQIMAAGIATAGIEYLFEKLSIEKFYDSAKTLGKGGLGNLVKDVLAQGGINASEEGATALGNIAYDALFLPEYNEFGQMHDYYSNKLQLGDEKANAIVMGKIAERVGEEALAGGLQGLLMAGASNSISAGRTHGGNRQAGQAAMDKDTQRTIINMGLSMEKDTAAWKMADKLQGKKEVKQAELGRLLREEIKAAEGGLMGAAPALQQMQNNVMQHLQNMGETGDVEGISTAVVDMLIGTQLDNEQMTLLAGSDAALKYLEDAMTEKGMMQETAKETPAEEADMEEADMDEAPWQEETEAETMLEEETEEAEEAVPERKLAKLEGLGTVEETEEGVYTVRNEAGEETSLDEADMDEGEKRVIMAGLKRGNDALTDSMRNAYRAKPEKMDGENAAEWAEGYMTVAQAAQRGAASVDEVRSLFAGALTKDEAEAAFAAGKTMYAQMQAKAIRQTEANAKKYGYEMYAPENAKKAGVLFTNVTRTLNNTEQTMLKVIDRFAREYGMQVRVHDSMGKANAKYIRNTNQIDLALDADEGALTRVTSHEMYHYLKQFSPRAAAQMQKMVADALAKNGADVQQLVQNKINKYKKAGVELTQEDAMEEITADGMLDFIGTEENLKALVKESRSTAEKLAEWLRNAVRKLRSILQKVAGKNEVVARLMDDAEYLEERSRVLDDALRQAGENYRAVQQGLYEDMKKLPDVAEYREEMAASTNKEQAQVAFDGLALAAFSKTQGAWLAKNADADIMEGVHMFTEALKEYGRHNVFLGKALEDRGFTAPKAGTQDMALLAYVGRQAALNDFSTMRADESMQEEAKFSLKEGETTDKEFLEEMSMEPGLVMQIRMDENVQGAVDTFQQLRKNNIRKLTGEKLEQLVTKAANRIIAETGTKMSLQKLKKELRRLYQAMNIQPGNELQYADADIVRYARVIARHALQKTQGATDELSDNERDVRDFVRNTPFSLNEKQKSEVAATYGSVGAFMQKNFGRMKIRKFDRKSSDLEQLWDEFVQMDPSVFKADADAGDMPLIVDAFMDRIYDKNRSETLMRDAEYEATKIAMENLLDFYDVAYDQESINKAIREKGRVTGEAERLAMEYEPELVRRLRNEMQTQVTAMGIEYEERYRRRLEGDKKRREAQKRKTTIKNQIRQDAKYLNDRLLMNANEKHIPDPLKGTVLRMMEALTEESGVFYGERLTQLRQAYKMLEENGDYADTGAARMYDPVILDKLEELERTLNGKRMAQLSEKQLQDVADIVGHIRHVTQNVNAVFIDGKKENFTTISQEEREVLEGKKDIKHTGSLIQKTLSANTLPIYFFKNMGGVWKKMFDDVMAGQDKWAFTVKKSKDFLAKALEKHKADEWLYDKETLRFTSVNGDQLEMDKKLALSLYATWKRETTNTMQQAQHLKIGGFMYDQGVKYDGVETHKPHKLTQMDINTIQAYLGEEGMKFADDMVEYLSKDMAELGNETSVQLYGYKKFGEGYYFPYKTSRDFLTTDLTKADTADVANALRGWGASKQLQKKANKPVVVGNFIETWSKHVNEMAVYNAFTVPVDNISRVYNYTERDADDNMYSMRSEIRRVYGEEADGYIRTLIQDIAGGVTKKDRTDMTDKMIGLSKKAAVVASASVAIQQPSSIMRAMALVNPKYFITPGNVVKEYQQMREYSGLAIIKEIGRFDTGTGKSAMEWMTDVVKPENAMERIGDTADKVTGFAPEKADQMTWAMIWHAVKKEVAEQQGLDMSTEKGLQAAAKRFNEVINYTQVYDSVLSRSHIMRDKGGMAKMFTAYMAEPTVSFNLLKDAITHMKDKNYVGRVSVKRAAAAYTTSVLVNALLKSLITAGRKDDDKRTYAEKYIVEVHENFWSDWNPLALLPGVRDIISIFSGYDVERTDMSIIADLKDGLDVMLKWANGEEVETSTIIEKGFGSIANLFGIPLKNIARDFRTADNIFFRSKPLSETSGVNIKYGVLEGLPFGMYKGTNTAYYERMADAANSGDVENYEEMLGYMTSAKGVEKKKVETGVRSLLYDELYEAIDNRQSPKEAIELLKQYGAEAKTIRGQITAKYKKQYIKLYNTNKARAADLKAYILTALELLGYDREKASKDIDEWIKE